MRSHSDNISINSDETTDHASKNQRAYNQFWLEHSKLSLYKSTKFLAHRDLFQILNRHLFQAHPKSKYKILDFGCGAGETAQVISDLFISCGKAVELHGVDINQKNIDIAKEKNPNGKFSLIEKNAFPLQLDEFDLVICNFVLLENQLADVQVILESIQHSLSDRGIAIVTHNTAKVYDSDNNWVSFNTKYVENKRNYQDSETGKLTREDGSPVKKGVLNEDGKITFTFSDFFYRRRTYKKSFLDAKLELIGSYKPLGNSEDPVTWQSEKDIAPYRVDVLRKSIVVAAQNEVVMKVSR